MIQPSIKANEGLDWDRALLLFEQAREIESRIRHTRDVNERKVIAEKALAEEIDEEWERRAAESPGGAFLLLWKMRLHSFADQHEDVRRMALILAGERTVAPEVWVIVSGTPVDRETRLEREAYIGQLLPVSNYGGTRDSNQGEAKRWYEFPDPPLPVIPTVSSTYRNGSFRAAELAEKIYRYPHIGRDAWLEVVYCYYSPMALNRWGIGREGWLSEETGDIWIRLAKLESRISDPRQAANYLAKAMICGGDRHFEEGVTIINTWQEEPEGAAFDVDADDLSEFADDLQIDDVLRLAMLYRDMVLHPRAMELTLRLEEIVGEETILTMPTLINIFRMGRLDWGVVRFEIHELITTTTSGLHQMLMDEWIHLVERRNRNWEKAILFGQPADTQEQIRNIVIPRILQDDVIAELAEKLPEILEAWKERDN